MDWKIAAVQRLKDYEARKQSVYLLGEQIKTLELQYTAIRAASTDGTPVSGGGGNRREDSMLNNIATRTELENNRKIARREVEITERGLASLSAEERKILEGFYIKRQYSHVSRLCDELNVEKSEVYRRKDAALDKFTIACYGVVRI